MEDYCDPYNATNLANFIKERGLWDKYMKKMIKRKTDSERLET